MHRRVSGAGVVAGHNHTANPESGGEEQPMDTMNLAMDLRERTVETKRVLSHWVQMNPDLGTSIAAMGHNLVLTDVET